MASTPKHHDCRVPIIPSQLAVRPSPSHHWLPGTSWHRAARVAVVVIAMALWAAHSSFDPSSRSAAETAAAAGTWHTAVAAFHVASGVAELDPAVVVAAGIDTVAVAAEVAAASDLATAVPAAARVCD